MLFFLLLEKEKKIKLKTKFSKSSNPVIKILFNKLVVQTYYEQQGD